MNHEHFMRIALKEAEQAYKEGEVPVGAIVVLQDQIISRGYNQVEKLNDSTAHAEMIALTSAFNALGSKYLNEATIYITLEPCLMCAGAIRWSKISRIVYGGLDPKNGCQSFVHKHPYHEKAEVTSGILENECLLLMKNFFKEKR